MKRGVIAAVALAAAIRVTVLATKWNDPLLLNDSIWYSAQARWLIHGHGFNNAFSPHPTAEHGPLTPILLAPVSWGQEPFGWQRLVMTALGIGTVVLIALVAAEIAGPKAGVIAAFLAAVAPNLWVSDAVVMAETPTIFFLCLSMLCILRARRSGRSARWLVATGLSIGLAALARSEMVLLAPMFAWVAHSTIADVDTQRKFRGYANALVIMAATTLAISPWVVRNLIVFEQPVVLTTNDGATFLGANCPDSYFGDDIGGWSWVCVLEAGGPSGEEGSVRSDRYRSIGLEYASDHLTRIPVVTLARVGRVLDVYGLESQVAVDVAEDRDEWAAWAGIVSWWLLAAGALVGMRRVQRNNRLIFAAPVIIAALVAVVFYGHHRLRAPVEPVVVILSALAIEHWWRSRRGDPVSDGSTEEGSEEGSTQGNPTQRSSTVDGLADCPT